MRTERLGLEHKELLSQRLRDIPEPISEYSFPNLYLFRDNHSYEVLIGDETFIRGRAYEGFSYVMPTVPVSRIDPSVLRNFMRQADFLFPIPESWLARLSSDEFDVAFHEGDADYLYTVSKMSSFSGRKLHKKRNLLKQFQERYRHEALPLAGERLDHARFVLEEWKREVGPGAGGTDYDACREALDQYEELSLCGGVIYAQGEPAGFALGEELNDETYVLHFAKARIAFKGSYQYLYNSFAKVLPPKYRYLNLEQDLGKENLRVFKSSYVPDAMLRKARVKLK